jgi:aspartyl protease family protein
MKVTALLAFLLIAALLLLFRNDIQFLSDMGTLEIVIVAGGLLLIAGYVLLLLSSERDHPLQALRYLLIWGVIGLGLVAAYSYRQELSGVADRLAGELAPPGHTISVGTTDPGESAVRVRRRPDGHFAVRGAINGQSMTMLVDTGASTVVLKPADAARAGIDTRDLEYTAAVHTANGTAYAAPVRLRSVTVGPLVVQNVDALVARPGSLKENLLGMSFLRRLRSYEFSKDFLTLRG